MRAFFILIVFGLQAGIFIACTPNQRIVNSSAEFERAPTPLRSSDPPAVTSVEDEIAAMRTADFTFIYVFRRRDGGEFNADDRAFLNANTPYEVNRRMLAEGGRALVVGSNFRFPDANFKLITQRFAFEDHSRPESEIKPSKSQASNR